MNFQIFNKTRARLPRLPFSEIKIAVLGRKYELSLVFTTDAELEKLNRIYRHKKGTTDVLSFPLSKNNGEIYISAHEAHRQAPLFGFLPSRSINSATSFATATENFIGFLFIHGMLHLKGYAHGSTMEHEEAKFVKKFCLSSSFVK